MLNQEELNLFERNINEIGKFFYSVKIDKKFFENNDEIEKSIDGINGHFSMLLRASGINAFGNPLQGVVNNVTFSIVTTEDQPARGKSASPVPSYRIQFVLDSNLSTNFLESHYAALTSLLRVIEMNKMIPYAVPFIKKVISRVGHQESIVSLMSKPSHVDFPEFSHPFNKIPEESYKLSEFNFNLIKTKLPSIFKRVIDELEPIAQEISLPEKDIQNITRFNLREFFENMYGSVLIKKDVFKDPKMAVNNYWLIPYSPDDKVLSSDENTQKLLKIVSLLGPNSNEFDEISSKYFDSLLNNIRSKYKYKDQAEYMSKFPEIEEEMNEVLAKESNAAFNVISEVADKLSVEFINKMLLNKTFNEDKIKVLAAAKTQAEFNLAMKEVRDSSVQAFDNLVENEFYRPLQKVILADEKLHVIAHVRKSLTKDALKFSEKLNSSNSSGLNPK